jgi:hypothetical protein
MLKLTEKQIYNEIAATMSKIQSKLIELRETDIDGNILFFAILGVAEVYVRHALNYGHLNNEQAKDIENLHKLLDKLSPVTLISKDAPKGN